MDIDEIMAADPAADDLLVLVDALDRERGTATKARAHIDGLLHRAFSVVLVRDGSEGPEILLAKRSMLKYHSGGLWANSCCSHPRAGEELLDAAYQRVHEELGCEAEGLREIGSFAYRAVFGNGLCEHEYDHVLVGRALGTIDPAPEEASEVRWIGADELASELADKPEIFSAWAPMVFSLVLKSL